MKQFELIIFDLDGLLIDSERIALEQFLLTAEEFGIKIDHTVYTQCIGANAKRVDEILSIALSEHTDYLPFKAAWRGKYKSLMENHPIPLKLGAIEILKDIKSRQQNISLATSTETPQAIIKLSNAGITEYFDAVIGGDQVLHSKPAPDIFLRAAETFNVMPGKCLVLEDSENGVNAAINAGMKVIQIPDLVAPSAALRQQGHIILKSLQDVINYRF
jgi:beta-phosphoglucomutase-like phosphatase (HAD superfamily)